MFITLIIGNSKGLIRKTVKVLVTQLCLSLLQPAHQAPLSIEFSRQEYWVGLPLPSPKDLSDPGMETGSSALQILYCLSHQRSLKYIYLIKSYSITVTKI